jgi:hypothetical protein
MLALLSTNRPRHRAPLSPGHLADRPLGSPGSRWGFTIHQMNVRVSPLALVLVVALAACSTTPTATQPAGLFFPTVPRLDAYPSALLTAPLHEHAGCLFGGEGKRRVLLLWPDGYQAKSTFEGWEILNDEGAVVATEGQRLNLGGGETNAVLPTDQQIPERCGRHYWLVAPS